VKLTEEIKERIDRRGNNIDFAFCFRCYGFLDISDNIKGEDVKCLNCHTDEFLDINDKRYSLYLIDDSK
jgi:hypothetical protein